MSVVAPCISGSRTPGPRPHGAILPTRFGSSRSLAGVLLGLLAFGVATPATAALPPVPAPLEITSEESARLDHRETVVRLHVAEGEAHTTAFVNVTAAPAVVMAAVMDLPPRVADIDALKEAEVYLDEPGRMGARWALGAGPFSIEFHVLYEFDFALGWSVYTIDKSQENDLSYTAGSYQVYAIPSGSRLVYRAQSKSSYSVANRLKQHFIETNGVDLLEGIRARAESSSSGAAR